MRAAEAKGRRFVDAAVALTEISNMCCGYGKGLLENATGPKTALRDMIKTSSEDAMDLVTKLLVFDPTKRLTASQALAHPYVSK